MFEFNSAIQNDDIRNPAIQNDDTQENTCFYYHGNGTAAGNDTASEHLSLAADTCRQQQTYSKILYFYCIPYVMCSLSRKKRIYEKYLKNKGEYFF